ncbi:MAG: succinate dehydrogenase, hydrophobic membrane anchor protein [Parvibaculaceae bacterium]
MRTPLSRVLGLGAAKSGVGHWWHQRLTAIANIPLVIFTVVLLVRLTGAEHAHVASVLSHPLVALGLVATLLSVTWHMRLGMQVIIEDYVHTEGLRVLAIVANILFCAAVALIGLFAVLKLAFGG